MTSEPSAQQGWRCTVHLNSLLPKINEDLSDCQDSTGADAHNGRFCISDGATQSFFSNLWSQELCKSFCASVSAVNSSNWREWLEAAQVNWHQLVTDRCVSLQLEKKISWIECSNGLSLKKPAYATFTGFTIENDFLKGISIGDSFAFLLKVANTGSCLPENQAFVIERILPGLWRPDFSNRTEGLSSYNANSEYNPEFFEIPICSCGDSSIWILMMSDALARFTIEAERKGSSILSDLVKLSSPAEFEQFVSELRVNGMGNDDTSLLCIQVQRVAQLTIGENLVVMDDPVSTDLQSSDLEPPKPTDATIDELELSDKDDPIDSESALNRQELDCLIEPPTGQHLLDTSDINSIETHPSSATQQLPSGPSIADCNLQVSDISIDAEPPLKRQDEEGRTPDYVDDTINESLSSGLPRHQVDGEGRASVSPSLPRFLDRPGEAKVSNLLHTQISKLTRIFNRSNTGE